MKDIAYKISKASAHAAKVIFTVFMDASKSLILAQL
jgi:hypothetical protein